MGAWKLVLAEIACRPVNFVLSALAVVTAAALFVAGPTLLSGYAAQTRHELSQLEAEAARLQAEAEQMQQETDRLLAEMDKQTRRIMRDLGVNLRIVHKDTNFGSLYTDFVAHDFPEDYVYRLAQAEHIETIVHLVASLQEKIKWNGRTVLLVGTLPVMTMSQKNEEKPHMVKPVEPGTVLVGHELGQGLKEGQKLEINGHQLTVAKIMPEYGTLQDVQLVVDLHDAQKILGKQGRVNQILALNCKCKGNRISAVRAELEKVLPDTKVTEFKTRAEAREKQRDLVAAKRQQQLAVVQANRQRVEQNRKRQEASYRRQQRALSNLLLLSTPLVVLVSALFVGLMTWLNVRERRTEIGLLRALGKGTVYVVTLFMGKSLLVGTLGGLIGCGLGYAVAIWIGQMMQIQTDFFRPDYAILLATVLGAPIVAAMASYLPTLSAITQDPAVVLMDN